MELFVRKMESPEPNGYVLRTFGLNDGDGFRFLCLLWFREVWCGSTAWLHATMLEFTTIPTFFAGATATAEGLLPNASFMVSKSISGEVCGCMCTHNMSEFRAFLHTHTHILPSSEQSSPNVCHMVSFTLAIGTLVQYTCIHACCVFVCRRVVFGMRIRRPA